MAIGFATGLTMPTGPELTSRRQDRRITIAVCIVLTLLVWLVFAQTLRYDFVNFDDDRYVYENSQVSRGFTLDGFNCFSADRPGADLLKPRECRIGFQTEFDPRNTR